MRVVTIPAEGPIEEKYVDESLSTLHGLQELVGGNIEALPCPESRNDATCYINEEGKYTAGCEPNVRATCLYSGGIGLQPGDYIAGTLVLAGIDFSTGESVDLPADITVKSVKRALATWGAGWTTGPAHELYQDSALLCEIQEMRAQAEEVEQFRQAAAEWCLDPVDDHQEIVDRLDAMDRWLEEQDAYEQITTEKEK